MQNNNELLNNIRSTNADYAMYWHALTVNSTIALMSLNFVISGYILSKNNMHVTLFTILCALILFIGCTDVALIRIFAKRIAIHQKILAKIDKKQLLFEEGIYMREEVYPKEWVHSGKSPLSEPIAKFCTIASLATSIFLIIIISLAEFIFKP